MLAHAQLITVVMPVYNHWELSACCLDSLYAHSTMVHDVYVIDNASSDQTPQNLIQYKKKFEAKGIPFQIFRYEKNVGFGRACNQGVRHFIQVNTPYVVILSNDTWLMPGWDAPLIQKLEEHNLDAIGPHFDENPFTNELPEISKVFVKKYSHKMRKHFVPMMPMLKRDAVIRLSQECPNAKGGVYDEQYYLTYEDTDLVTRMKKLSMKYGQTGASFIWHKSKGTRNSEPSGYEEESLKLFIQKWGFDPRVHLMPFWQRWKYRYWKYLTAKRKF